MSSLPRRRLLGGVLIGAIAVGFSLGTSLLLLDLWPATPMGWVIASVVGLPAVLLGEALVQLAGANRGAEPPMPSRYSYEEMKIGASARVRAARFSWAMLRFIIAMGLFVLLFWSADWLLESFPWLGQQFR